MYYKIVMPRGHQGTNRRDSPSGRITFYFEATSLNSAIRQAKGMPGVKHDKMPLCAVPVDAEEYYAMRKLSAYKRK